jgi:hypothetical protein
MGRYVVRTGGDKTVRKKEMNIYSKCRCEEVNKLDLIELSF